MNWYNRFLKIAQIWNVETGELDSNLSALYELEYKLSMLNSKPWNGSPERKENIEQNIIQKLEVVLDDIKTTLLSTFDNWLENHALFTPNTWASKRAEILIDGVGTEDTLISMIDEYLRYRDGKHYHKQFGYGDGALKYQRSEMMKVLRACAKDPKRFPEFNKVLVLLLYDYKQMEEERLNSEGFSEYGRLIGKRFRNEEQAENYIKKLTTKNIDIDYFIDDLASFASILDNNGYNQTVIAELFEKLVFPLWFEYWSGAGIENTRKNIETIREKLYNMDINDIKNAIAVISIALNACHQTGDMLDYIADEEGGSAQYYRGLLDQLSAGTNVEEWNRQLREVGVEL